MRLFTHEVLEHVNIDKRKAGTIYSARMASVKKLPESASPVALMALLSACWKGGAQQ